jgi:PAS domain S-box-containing protein
MGAELREDTPQPTKSPLRILFVEDSPEDVELMVRALRIMARPIAFERVEEAEALRAALDGGSWDVVFSDWTMPRFNALAALGVLKDSGADVPFIIVSGTISDENAVTAMRAGAEDYLRKNNLLRLAPAVERALSAAEARRREERSAAARAATDSAFRSFVENTCQGVWLVDTEVRTTFINARMAQLLGCEPAEARSPLDFLEPARAASFREELAAQPSGSARERELELVRRDGSAVTVMVESSPMIDRAGRRDGAALMVRDVSARKRAEAALRDSESRFRRLWESGIALMTIGELDGPIHDVNEAGARMVGYSREELLARRWRDLTPPEWQDADATAREQMWRDGVARPFVKELVRKDGARVPILACAAMLADSQGIGLAVELTDRDAAQAPLRERVAVAAMTSDVGQALTSGEPLRHTLQRAAEAVVEHLDVALARVWTLDAASASLELQASAGVTTRIDGAHCRLALGSSRVGRVAAEGRADVIHAGALPEGFDDPSWMRREGITAFAAYPLVAGSGLMGAMAIFSRHPLSDEGAAGLSRIADAVAVAIHRARAALARSDLDEQLRQLQKMEVAARLAGGVAHDFNNLLSVIITFAELLAGDLEADDPRRGDVEEIREAASRGAALTQHLLTFSRQQVLEPRLVDPGEVVARLEPALRRAAEGVELGVLNVARGLVRIDLGSFEKAVTHLVAHARSATLPGRAIAVEVADVDLDEAYAHEHIGVTPGPHLRLAVSDGGPGLDAATQARLFEPFFARGERGKGNGLRLATVFGIVHHAGGTLRVDSTPEVGTTITVHLPHVAHAGGQPPGPTGQPAGQAPRAAAPRAHDSETILLVEVAGPAREARRALLERAGFEVLSAGDAGEALQLSNRHAGFIHLLVCSPIDAEELARRLAAARPEMKTLPLAAPGGDVVEDGALATRVRERLGKLG